MKWHCLAESLATMATLIPSLGTARFDSRGELRLAERLKDFLEDNSYIWHNLPMGPRGRHPDFVIVHPAKGLLVLEVKDWRLDSIASATKSEVESHGQGIGVSLCLRGWAWCCRAPRRGDRGLR
jgi:hypothetical protein